MTKIVNLDFRLYIRFLNWMPAALQMPEPELIDHAGLDSAVYLRIYLLGHAPKELSYLKLIDGACLDQLKWFYPNEDHKWFFFLHTKCFQ